MTARRVVGLKAASMVRDGQLIGLGTGSTAACAIEAMGHRVREEQLNVVGVATSSAAELLAIRNGIPLRSLQQVKQLDYAFDGADEVDPKGNLVKGRGAAHTREKVVAALAKRFVVLVDKSKCVLKLGMRMPLPVEVLPMAATPVLRSIEALGGIPCLRMGVKKDGPVVTDQGFWVIDARFEKIEDPALLGQELVSIPGVLDHGLFVGMATDILIGDDSGGLRHLRP